MKEEMQVTSGVDTLEVKISLENSGSEIDHIGFTKTNENIKTMTITYKVNPNKIEGECNLNTNSKYVQAMENIFCDLSINEFEDVKISRLDFHFDTSDLKLSNPKDRKLLKYMFELFTPRAKDNNIIESMSRRKKRLKSLMYTERYFALEIYDKELESNGAHPHDTRIELRFKRNMSKTIYDNDYYIKKVEERLKILSNSIEHVNRSATDTLKEVMLEEIARNDNTYKGFSHFVDRYKEDIYTMEILEGLYKVSGLKGKCSEWVKYYKKKNTLELYKRSDVAKFQRSLTKALKYYKNN